MSQVANLAQVSFCIWPFSYNDSTKIKCEKTRKIAISIENIDQSGLFKKSSNNW